MNDAFQVTIVSKLEMFQVMLSSKLRVVYEYDRSQTLFRFLL